MQADSVYNLYKRLKREVYKKQFLSKLPIIIASDTLERRIK